MENQHSVDKMLSPSQIERGPPENTLEQAISEENPEAKQVPEWFRQTAKTITNAWFDPKSFEQHPGLYEQLGVKTFKRYVPTGDLIYLAAWKKLSKTDMVTLSNPNTLKTTEFFTRVYETIHLAGFAVMSAEIGVFLANHNMNAVVFIGALNTFWTLAKRGRRIKITLIPGKGYTLEAGRTSPCSSGLYSPQKP